MKDTNINEIIKTYYDISLGALSIDKTYQILKPRYSKKYIKDVINKHSETQQIKDKKINKSEYIPIVATPGSYMCDLTFYDQYKKVNKGYGILLTIININTRYAYVYPLKNKNIKSIIEAFTDAITKIGDMKLLESDKGSEWISKQFQILMKDNNIHHIVINKDNSHNSMAIIERFNRTIREMIDKYMIAYKTHTFIDVLDQLVDNYNNSYHRGIKMKPVNMTNIDESKNYQNKLEIKSNIFINQDNQFNIGDKVRILKNKGTFSKGQSTYYAKQIYTIITKEYNSFIVRSNNGKEKKVQPFMIKKVTDIIDNPFIKKSDKTIKMNDTKFKNNVVKNKVNKELEKDGVDKNNIIRPKTRSGVRKKQK